MPQYQNVIQQPFKITITSASSVEDNCHQGMKDSNYHECNFRSHNRGADHSRYRGPHLLWYTLESGPFCPLEPYFDGWRSVLPAI